MRGPARAGPAAIAAVLAIALVAACNGGATAPTGPPLGTPAAGLPTQPPNDLPTPGSLPTPAAPAWPEGWDGALCAMFAQLVETQELAVDIGRALDEGDRDDARGLTAELEASAVQARALLDEIPVWTADEPLRDDVSELLDLADEMALRYDRHLNQGRRPARAAAERAGAQMRAVVDPLIDRLVLLSDQGLSCPGLAFDLETPPAE